MKIIIQIKKVNGKRIGEKEMENCRRDAVQTIISKNEYKVISQIVENRLIPA